MRIVVILGSVQDPSGISVNRRAGRVFVNREEYIIHPADRCALEAALRIKDLGGSEIVALPRSPGRDQDALLQSLARGADRAITVTEDLRSGADDAPMARLLAAIVQKLGDVKLVLTGSETLDSRSNQLGPRVAEALGWPQVLEAWNVDPDHTVLRAIQSRAHEFVRVEADLPALATVLASRAPLRFPDGVRLINVYRANDSVERWCAEDLLEDALPQDSLTMIGREFPAERVRGVRIEGTPADMAHTLHEHMQTRLRL